MPRGGVQVDRAEVAAGARERHVSSTAYLDDVTGSLEVGKLADVAVIDRDLFAPHGGPIGDARVLLTLVEGETVFADPSLSW